MFPLPYLSVWLRSAFVFLVCCFIFAGQIGAQVRLANGSISGEVTEATGAAIPGAHVALSSPDETIVRTSMSGSDGTFAISGLPSGTYRIEIAAAGFAQYRNESVAIATGREARIEARLAPSQTTEQVIVQGQTEALDTSQSSPVTNIDRDRIEELPIASRNYLSFTLLVPSLGSANPALSLYAPGSGAEGGFSAGGLRPSSNAIYLDGVDNNDEFTGLSRTELSPEAISDFQVVNHGYAAQSGGSAGGSVDVETRSGTNLQHGDAFLFLQNGALNATPPLELAPHKPEENRLRAGLATGGAVKKHKLFYYIAAEQEMAHGEEASEFDPRLASEIDAALQIGPLHGFHVQQGFFPTTNQETELSGRVDRAFGNNGVMLRYALTNSRSVNDALNTNDLADLSARGSAFYNDNSLNGSWSYTFSPSLVNHLNFEVAQRRVEMRTGSVNGPGVVVAGIAELGTPFAGNSRRYETHVGFRDGLMHQNGKHLYQGGVGFNHIALRAADLDGFGGLYVFPDLSALQKGQADFYTQSFGNPNTNFTETRITGFVEDHWAPLRSLSIDYGLRYGYNRLPTHLPQDMDNLSPRLGFAWSPNRDWVVRGGFGLFFDRYLLSTVNRIEEFDGVHAMQQIAEGPDAASFYLLGNSFTSPHAGIAPSIWQAQSRLANPYGESASLGVERALPAQWTVQGEYRFVRGVHMGRTINSNLPLPFVLTPGNAASLGIISPTPQQIGRPVFPQQRLNPAYDTINEFQTEAGSNYNGATLTLNRQFNEEFELMAGYTFSKTIDDASSDTEQPQNPCAPREERRLSLNDQRHRFVMSGLWILGPDLDDPKDDGRASANPLQEALYGLEFAPILAVDSGFPANPQTGVDSNREHVYPFAARPLGFSRNALETSSNVHFDLRILKMFPIWRGHLDVVAESFNLLNRQNIALVNPVYGSGVIANEEFKTPIQVADPGKIQFSLDFEY